MNINGIIFSIISVALFPSISYASCTVSAVFNKDNMPPPRSGAHQACIQGCDGLVAGARASIPYHANIPTVEAEIFAEEGSYYEASARLQQFINGAEIEKTALGQRAISFNNRDGSFTGQSKQETLVKMRSDAIRGITTIGSKIDRERAVAITYVGVSICSMGYARELSSANDGYTNVQPTFEVNPLPNSTQTTEEYTIFGPPKNKESEEWWSPGLQ